LVSGTERERKMLHCPALLTIKLIAGKWKTRILWALRTGPATFGELERQLPGISPKMLAEHLRQLHADGLITRSVHPIGKVETTAYAYSDYGKTLIPVLDAIGEWGLVHEQRQSG
jgi:DNA-binding HxlR family transcriptional regulator